MKQFLVYLAGPITGTTYGECTDWRKYVAQKFPEYIKGISPMRQKDYLIQERLIADSYSEHVLSCQKGITARDRYDVMRCDLIFVNLLGAKKVSIGTVMEIAWADMLRKPIVIVIEPDNIHQHAMLREVAGFIVSTLDEGIAVATAVLSTTC